MAPQTNGAAIVYKSIISPFLKKHEEEIESKDSRINLLENKIESLKISAEPNSPTTIRDRYGKEVFAINPSYE